MTTTFHPGPPQNATSALPSKIEATDFVSRLGTPSLSFQSEVPVWKMDAADAAGEYVLGSKFFADAANVDVSLHWINTVAASGNVRWQITMYVHDPDGGTVNTVLGSAAYTFTSVGIADLTTSVEEEFATGLSIPARHSVSVRVRRHSAAAEDTLPNDAGFAGIIFRQTP